MSKPIHMLDVEEMVARLRPLPVSAAVLDLVRQHLPNGDLPVLADALEEAGCTDAEVLVHLRTFHRSDLLTALECAVPATLRAMYWEED